MPRPSSPVVSAVRCPDYDPARVRDALRQALAPLGGLGAFVRLGSRVLVKPNFLKTARPEQAVTTHPQVILAVVEAALAEGASRVVVGDSPGVHSARAVARKLGLVEPLARLGVERIDFLFGTMIEVPRAALTADKIAESAQFFSFGTNDLTQMTFGFSRDDIGGFVPDYLQKKILPADPFQILDQEGVGQLVALAVERGRKTKPNLKIGICGEHGGEPSSVAFCHRVGMNYVSCSPFRVPIARLAAAQAALK